MPIAASLNIYDILPTLGPMNRILDIGCSRMVDTAKLRAMFPDAEIHAFDPDPRTATWLRAQDIPSRLNVKFHAIALSDRDGFADLFLSTGDVPDSAYEHTDSSSIRRPVAFDGLPAHGWVKFFPEPVVALSRRLDSCSFTPIDLIWMDAQSSEDLIIRGGQETLAHTRYLYTEHNTDGDYHDEPGLEGIKKLLPGWTVEHLWKDDVLLRNPKPVSEVQKLL